jgi:hypothetical protein
MRAISQLSAPSIVAFLQYLTGNQLLQTKRRGGDCKSGEMCAGTPPFCDFDKAESIFAFSKAKV